MGTYLGLAWVVATKVTLKNDLRNVCMNFLETGDILLKRFMELKEKTEKKLHFVAMETGRLLCRCLKVATINIAFGDKATTIF